MRRVMLVTIVLAVTCCLSLGLDSGPSGAGSATAQGGNPQQTTQPGAQQGQLTSQVRIAPGSVIPVQLTKTLDAKKVKTGDQVVVKVTQDLKTSNGEVIMPKDTEVVGHITEAQARSKGQKESELGIAFDHAVFKDGGDVALPASIQAVIAPPSQTPMQNNDNAGSGGAGSPGSAPTAGGMPPGNGPGRSPGMENGPPQQAPSSMPTQNEQPNTQSNGRPSITANTQGVVGISNYKLSTTTDVKQGSVVSSEKSNVKLESGTLMLLRVNS